MPSIKVGDKIEVLVTKITLGKDGCFYVTISHPDSPDHPSFRLMET